MTKSSSSTPVLCWATQGKTEHMATIVDPTVLEMLKKGGAIATAAAAAVAGGGGGGSLSTLPQDSKIKIKWESTLQKESVLVSSIRLASDEQVGRGGGVGAARGTRRRTSSRTSTRTTVPVSLPLPSKQRQKKETEGSPEEEENEEATTTTTNTDNIMMTIASNKNSKDKDDDNDKNIVKETKHDGGHRTMLAVVVEEDQDHQNDAAKTTIATSTKPKLKKAVISSSLSSPEKPSALLSSSSSSSSLLLPPPYSYDNLYSSYQNEWDQQKNKTKQNNISVINNDADNNDNIFDDNDVSDLKWVVVADDNNDTVTYLLACTSSGEIVSYRMITNNKNNNDEDVKKGIVDTSTLLLKLHGRLKICSSVAVDDDDCGDNSDGALNKMQIVSINATDDDGNDNTKNNDNSRKRRRNHDNNDNYDDKKQKQQLLIIAGERGLWSIPISDLLKSTTNDNCVASLLQLSDRPIVQLQIPPPLEENEEKTGSGNDDKLYLMALEKDTNIVSKWNLQTIIKRHNNDKKNKEGITITMDSSNGNNSNSCLITADKQFDLSRYFSASKSSKSNKRRNYSSKSYTKSINERATTILLVKSPPSSSLSVDDEGESSSPPSTSCSLSLLVGTDRSRLMILPLKNNNVDDGIIEHRFLSLKEDSSQQKMTTATTTTTTKPIWIVTDIIATHGGTWWTVSGVSNSNTGLLVTWHAPTGMSTARRQTREAIFKIATTENASTTDCLSSSSSSLSLLMYSVSNEAAVTMWNSSFQLERMGKFWVNSPSSKAVTVLKNENKDHNNHNNYVAVAGVGKRIDLFLDHCHVQTVRI
jgi:hypothetical protein